MLAENPESSLLSGATLPYKPWLLWLIPSCRRWPSVRWWVALSHAPHLTFSWRYKLVMSLS